MDQHQPPDHANAWRSRSPSRPDPQDTDVAVELRTAATVIIAYAQLLARRARLGNVPTAERIERDMATIERAARRVVAHSRDLEGRGER